MIFKVTGYTPEGAFAVVRERTEAAIGVGSTLRGFLREVKEPPVEAVLAFWRRAISGAPVELVREFGWLAEIRAIGDEKWMDLMLRTLEKTKGRVSHPTEKRVAERVAGLKPSRKALRLMDSLVRSGSPWDEVRVFPWARKLMERSHEFTGSDEYRRLKAALAERGARE